MKMHRKRQHMTSVRLCDEFQEDNCSNSDEKCWYIHLTKAQQKKLVDKCHYSDACKFINEPSKCSYRHSKPEMSSDETNSKSSDIEDFPDGAVRGKSN